MPRTVRAEKTQRSHPSASPAQAAPLVAEPGLAPAPRVPVSGRAFGDAPSAPVVQRYEIKPVSEEERRRRQQARQELSPQARAGEIASLREEMGRKDDDAVAPSLLRPHAPSGFVPGDFAKAETPPTDKRLRVDASMASRELPTPTVGISNRPGYGVDVSIFAKGSSTSVPQGRLEPGVGAANTTRFAGQQIDSTSLPHGFEPLPQIPKLSENPTEEELTAHRHATETAATEKELVQKARGRELDTAAETFGHGDGRKGLNLNEVSGIFIPGGQDREDDASPEKTTREAYEQQLIKQARQMGMPILAVCGGSRSLARGFGAQEVKLGGADKKVHKSTKTRAHEVRFPEPHSILGGAADPKHTTPDGTDARVDAMNSTHEKVVGHTKVPRGGALSPTAELNPVNKLPKRPDGTQESELMVSALDPKGNPEGFETRYGAPIVGVTSHPELIFGTASARVNATDQAVGFSDNVLKGFRQSMQAFDAKRGVVSEITRNELPKLRATAEGVATILEPVAQQVAAITSVEDIDRCIDALQRASRRLDELTVVPTKQDVERLHGLLAQIGRAIDQLKRTRSDAKTL